MFIFFGKNVLFVLVIIFYNIFEGLFIGVVFGGVVFGNSYVIFLGVIGLVIGIGI